MGITIFRFYFVGAQHTNVSQQKYTFFQGMEQTPKVKIYEVEMWSRGKVNVWSDYQNMLGYLNRWNKPAFWRFNFQFGVNVLRSSFALVFKRNQKIYLLRTLNNSENLTRYSIFSLLLGTERCCIIQKNPSSREHSHLSINVGYYTHKYKHIQWSSRN